MTNDLFTESDFTDAGGYNLNAKYIVEIANTRLKALIQERDEARELLQLIGRTLSAYGELAKGLTKDWGKACVSSTGSSLSP